MVSSEAKVGVLFFAGLVMILGFTLFVSKVGLGGGGDGFRILFPRVAGLDVGSTVTYNGIPIGRVLGVQPDLVDDEPMVAVEFGVEPQFLDQLRVSNTTRFRVSQGMLGGTSMTITHAGLGQPLTQASLQPLFGESPTTFTEALEQLGDVVDENRQPLNKAIEDLPRAVANVADMAAEMRDTIKENRSNLKGAVAGAKTMTESITALVDENRKDVNRAVKRIDAMAGQIETLVAENRPDLRKTVKQLPEAVDNISSAADEMRKAVAENRAYLNQALKHIANFAPKLDKIGTDVAAITGQIRSGHGTIGRLVFEDTLHEKATSAVDGFSQRVEEIKPFTSGISDLKIYLGGSYGIDVDSGAGTAQGYLRIEPKPWKFYEGGFGYRTAPRDRDTLDEDPEDLNIDLHLALGWRFFRDDDIEGYRLSVKGGLLEGALGGQFDYRISDRLTMSSMVRAKHNGYDPRDRRYEDGDTMARAWLEYRTWRRVSLIAGANDLVDEPAAFFGIRGELLDNDIRNLTTATAIAP